MTRAPHAHCHFTYRYGEYVSPWYWPTRADAAQASTVLLLAPQVTQDPEVYAVHADPCTCTEQEG